MLATIRKGKYSSTLVGHKPGIGIAVDVEIGRLFGRLKKMK